MKIMPMRAGSSSSHARIQTSRISRNFGECHARAFFRDGGPGRGGCRAGCGGPAAGRGPGVTRPGLGKVDAGEAGRLQPDPGPTATADLDVAGVAGVVAGEDILTRQRAELDGPWHRLRHGGRRCWSGRAEHAAHQRHWQLLGHGYLGRFAGGIWSPRLVECAPGARWSAAVGFPGCRQVAPAQPLPPVRRPQKGPAVLSAPDQGVALQRTALLKVGLPSFGPASRLRPGAVSACA